MSVRTVNNLGYLSFFSFPSRISWSTSLLSLKLKWKLTWKLQMSDNYKKQLHANFDVDFDMQNVLQKLIINIKIRQ